MSSDRIVTGKFRVSFPNVFKAHVPMSGQGDPQYDVQMLFHKEQDKKALTELKTFALAAAKAKWGEKIPAGLTLPFNDGDSKEYASHKGHIYINAKTKFKPQVVDQNVKEITDLEQDKFYAGCYARASLNAYAYEFMGKKGVAFGLMMLQKVAEGEPLGGSRPAPADDFAVVEGYTSDAENFETDF